MTPEVALAAVSRLAVGLRPEQAGVDLLLERIARRDDSEVLRAALVERGAAALLEKEIRTHG